jgi:hypothetical protein
MQIEAKKKRLSNDDVTCFGKGQKGLGEMHCGIISFYFLSSLGVNINGTAVIISDHCFERGLHLWYRQEHKIDTSHFG